ncbi:MAG: dienelactone hydrolase family protein [Deltaproteobacteria bacterium]|nr:dienelactone hydrolase family protein [Deltaproteobacteria bacterium]
MADRQSSAMQSSMVRFGEGIPGFRALPKAKDRRPAVILLHERYGIVQHTRDLTLKLAQAGYVGFAPDLFSRFQGDKKALQRGDTRVDLNDSEVIQDLDAAVDYLSRSQRVDASRISIVGICQTGRHALLFGSHKRDISSCVVFYGAVGGKEWTTDERRPQPVEKLIEKLACPVLGVFGEADHIISVEDVLRFRACLEQSKKNYHIRVYRDAPHGWLNDTMPGRYRKEAARDAWQLLLSFLKKSFTHGWGENRVQWSFDSDTSAGYSFDKNVRLE